MREYHLNTKGMAFLRGSQSFMLKFLMLRVSGKPAARRLRVRKKL